MVLKEDPLSSNRDTVALSLEVLVELHHMAVHQVDSRNQPTPTTEMATETQNLLRPLHLTNKRLENVFYVFPHLYPNFKCLIYSIKQQPPMPYEFAWEVKDEPTKNDYAHEAKSDGKVVTGSYRVLLPDGRTQIVSYRADENGYVADVKYEGEAQFPAPSGGNGNYGAGASAGAGNGSNNYGAGTGNGGNNYASSGNGNGSAKPNGNKPNSY
jgi:hypothetical protein